MNGGHSMFEKHEIVGKGAYGAVYRGTNKQTGEVVALKVRLPVITPVVTRLGLPQSSVSLLALARRVRARDR